MQNAAKASNPVREERSDRDLKKLNERIDKAIARFDQMRRDYRFLAGPGHTTRKG